MGEDRFPESYAGKEVIPLVVVADCVVSIPGHGQWDRRSVPETRKSAEPPFVLRKKMIGDLDREPILKDVGQILHPRPCCDGLSLVDQPPEATAVGPRQAKQVLGVAFDLLEGGGRTLPIPKVGPGEQLIQVGISLSIFSQ
jgi:hypothetical protein